MREHWLLPEAPYRTYADYLTAMGSSAVDLARRRDRDQLLAEIKHSGLRGRGGAGFPTGVKWTSVRQHLCSTRFVVVNAAEGEPGTFKDRWLIRANPYAVIEGLLIAAHVIDAWGAFIAIKAAFNREIERLRDALAEMTPVIGELPVEIVPGPDEYLFGEEKALLNVIEGNEPLPRPAEQPPYEVGLFATPAKPNPALVNNVQTLAHVSTIVRWGADSFRRLGTDDTPGTILFTLSGDIARPGVYEAEAGLTLHALLHDLGGGPRPGRTIKALLPGVSAPAILPDKLDTPADFGSLSLAGSALGAAGFVVVDDLVSMPRVAQAVARFLYVESCNQCSACKAGLRVSSRAIEELFDATQATPDDPDRAIHGALSAPQGNRCYLPVQGSKVIPALLGRFQDEVAAQLRRPGDSPPAWPIPKLLDYDEAARTFILDDRQLLKQPDWTYREPAQRSPVDVALPAELAERLREIADRDGVDLDQQVARALGEWLGKRAQSPGPGDA